MKVIKPAWVEHGGLAIYSVDVSPDDLRFATGGQGPDSGRIMIWNIGPLLDESLEVDENVPKVLGQLDYHTGCVNCVRWNKTGDLLASCSDDKTVMIFRNFAISNDSCNTHLKQVDSWRLSGTLMGHKSDVIDLCWAPREACLASCSVDNTVIIWNIEKMNMIVQIGEHKGLVKGVTWDPLEQYIASQSNDKTMRVFRTKDWKQETVFSSPFTGSGDTTVVTRLDWSPDGQYIVCPNACKAGGPTARVIQVTRPFPDAEIISENDELDLVGHRKAIGCVKFHPRLWRVKAKDKTHCVFATGSRDCTVAVWSSARQRPVAILKNFFTTPVTDLCWSRCSHCLLACSPGGEIAAFHFKEGELGLMLSEEEQQQALESSYGDMVRKKEKEGIVPIVQYAQNLPEVVPMEVETNGAAKENAKPPVIADVEMVKNQDKKATEENGVPNSHVFKSKEHVTNKILEDNIFNPPAESVPAPTFSEQPKQAESQTAVNVVQRKQLEMRRADGKRRVTPITLPREGPPAGAKIQVVIEEMATVPEAAPVARISTRTVTQSPVKTSSIIPVSVPSTPAVQRPVTPAIRTVAMATLEPLSLRLGMGIRIEGEESDWLEVIASKPQGVLSVKRRTRKNNRNDLWSFLYGHSVASVRSSLKTTVIACTNGSLHFVDTASGSPRLPPMILPGPAAYLNYIDEKVLLVTTQGYLYVYVKGRVILADMTLRDILLNDKGRMTSVALGKFSDCGDPVLVLTNGLCISWKRTIGAWTILWDANSPIYRVGRELAPLSNNKDLPLRSLADACCHYVAKTSLKQHAANGPSYAASFLQHQMLAAQHLGSSIEYKFNLIALVRHYAQENQILELQKLLNNLGEGNNVDLKLLGLTKKALLQECITTLKEYNACERLCTEFEALLTVM